MHWQIHKDTGRADYLLATKRLEGWPSRSGSIPVTAYSASAGRSRSTFGRVHAGRVLRGEPVSFVPAEDPSPLDPVPGHTLREIVLEGIHRPRTS